MDDDIDIEEHDVLENPVLKSIFPDISIIKKEITQYFEDEPVIKEEPDVAETKYQELSKDLPSNVFDTDLDYNDTTAKSQLDTENSFQNKETQQSNTILLGSKPNVVIQQDGKELIKNSKMDDVIHKDNKKYIFDSMTNEITQNFSKKVVLSSKPSTVASNTTEIIVNKTNCREKVKFKQTKLILQDIKSYLNQNERYCKLCCRLFLSKAAHDIHRNKDHYNGVYKNKHSTKNVNRRMKETETATHKCTICDSFFANSGNLSRHYKNIHNKKSMKKNRGAKTQTNSETVRSNSSWVKNKINTENGKKHIFKQTVQTKNKCNVCHKSYKTFYSLTRHYIHKHKRKLKINKNIATGLSSDTKSLKETEIATTNNLDTDPSANKKRKLLENNSESPSKNLDIATEENLNSTIRNTRNTRASASKYVKEMRPENSENNVDTASIELKRMVISTREQYNILPDDITKIQFTLKDHEVETGIDEIKANKKLENANKDSDVAFEEDSTHAKNSPTKDNIVCLHCNNVFVDQKSLIDHMYKILQTNKKLAVLHKNTDDTDVLKHENNKMYEILKSKKQPDGLDKNTDSDVIKNENDKILFVCRHCSYYMPSLDAYIKHLIRNHKIDTFLEVNKEKFHNQCKYCPYMNSNISTHNNHIHTYHMNLMYLKIGNEIDNDAKNQRENCEILFTQLSSFALESVLFECNKCSVHFLSSTIAKHHKQHIELLMNWKCSICHRILKEHDKEVHLKQHVISKLLKVINLNETALNFVLYNCTKCAIHFTEKRYQEHYPNCESETTDSTYCKICDILVDKIEISHHKKQHEHLGDGLGFTIIDSNIILDPANGKTIRKTVIPNTESEIRPQKRYNERYNCLTYCSTCKCFLSDLGMKNQNHINGTCTNIFKYTCPLCGLVFTSSVSAIHKERHKNDKKLKLQDYKFFDFEGKQLCPPIPEYPDCKICDVHFLNKNAIRSHLCGEIDFLTCDICNIKLSETAFKLHMSFHLYVIHRTPFQNDRCSLPDPSTKSCSKRKHTDISENITSTKGTCHESKISKRNTKNKSITESLKTEKSHEKIRPESSTKPLETTDQNKVKMVRGKLSTEQSNKDPLVIMYTCKSCSVAVESYDEVIKHCQNHYDSIENQITSVKKCKQCSLNVDSHFYMQHQRRIHSGVSKVHILKFDPTYFTSKSMIWIQHIFQTLPEELVNELLEKSIYQHEHRLKLEWSQYGSSNINVYKCDTCKNYIDPGCVYKHAQNSCSDVRKYACSFCGLPFVSSFSRRSHEKLHSQIKGISKKSVNIIIFNQSKDKSYNNRIFCTTNQYIFYQCRNCDGVAEKSMLMKHLCDRNTLLKCITCGLLITKAVFKAHVSKHTEIRNYNSENFKVILFGDKNRNDINKDVSNELLPSFKGTVYDYSLYKCQSCEICIRNKVYIEKHTCTPNFDLDRIMCLECDLYFPLVSYKHHMIQHMTDPDFIKENMNVITFQDGNVINISSRFAVNIDKTTMKENQTEILNLSSDSVTKIIIDEDNGTSVDADTTIIIADNEEKSKSESGNNNMYDLKEKIFFCRDNLDIVNYITDINDDNDSQEQVVEGDKDSSDDTNKSIDDINYEVHEEPDIIFKCTCGLHFINKQNIKEHGKACQQKTKQYTDKCSKCNLLFNPSELFSHLVIHHKDKTQVQDFKIINISNMRVTK